MSKHYSINITPNTKISGRKRSQNNNNNNAKLASRNKPCPLPQGSRKLKDWFTRKTTQVKTENKIQTKTQHVNTPTHTQKKKTKKNK